MERPKVVIAPEGCEEYLTAGKEYEVLKASDYSKSLGYFIRILDDYGEILYGYERQNSHLNGKDWLIKETE